MKEIITETDIFYSSFLEFGGRLPTTTKILPESGTGD